METERMSLVRVSIAALGVVIASWVLGGCSGLPPEGRFEPGRSTNFIPESFHGDVKAPPLPEGLQPAAVALRDVRITVGNTNLAFEDEAVRRDARSRFRTALLSAGRDGDRRFRVVENETDADLLVEVQVSKLTWDRKGSTTEQLFGGNWDASNSRSVDRSYIEAEVEVTFFTPDGTAIVGHSGGGRAVSDNGRSVQLVESADGDVKLSRVSEFTARPADGSYIPDALRYAIIEAVTRSLTSVDNYLIGAQGGDPLAER